MSIPIRPGVVDVPVVLRLPDNLLASVPPSPPISVLMRRVLLLLFGSFLILAGGGLALVTVFLVFMHPPRFASTARIVPGVTDPAALATEVQKILSQPILHQVVTNLSLGRLWGEKFKEGELPPAVALALLKRDLEVRRSRDTHLIDIKFESDTPEEASHIANAIAEAYRDSAFAPKGSDGKSSVQILDKAQPNLRPVHPKKLRTFGIGCLVGVLLAAIGVAFLVGALRRPKPVPSS